MSSPVYLITGAARRIGAAIAQTLHQLGARLVLHYHTSYDAAAELASQLNQRRPDSCVLVQANLLDTAELPSLIHVAIQHFGRLDGLVNNASSFFSTPLETLNATDWDDLIGTNLKAPLFLAQAAAPYLRVQRGAIIGIIDIHAEHPLPEHLIYNLAKAGHAQLIRALALELAPHIRVNGVAPGANIWPEHHATFSPDIQQKITASIPLERIGTPYDIAQTVAFLLNQAPYITGQIIAVDGGRSVALGRH